MSGANRLRFAGKIYGTVKDYWLVSGFLPDEGGPRPKAGAELRGEGVNSTVYWVADDLMNDWVQLPDCLPEHINAARSVKRTFTGNLNAEVISNPAFPGKERHFLRAQLARIFHATALSPKGLYEMTEEEGDKAEVKVTEDFPFPSAEELKDTATWANTLAQITKNGTTAHIAPEGMDEDEEAAWKEKMEAEDPIVERFRGTNEHNPVPGTATNPEDTDRAFGTRVAGDTQQYNKLSGAEGATSAYCVNIVRSYRWPGALTVAKGNHFTSIYIGNGIKKGGECMTPFVPPEVLNEPKD